MLRAGNAGSNTAEELIAVLAEAVGQIPSRYRRKLLITCDSAGASHGLVDWLVNQNHAADRHVEFSVGFDVDADVRAAIGTVRRDCWVPALDNTTGAPRDDADVTEITALMGQRLRRTDWPRRLRVIVRRTRLAAGEQPTLFTLDGYKYSVFITNTTTLSVQMLDARHRVHARVVMRSVKLSSQVGVSHGDAAFGPSHGDGVPTARRSGSWFNAVAALRLRVGSCRRVRPAARSRLQRRLDSGVTLSRAVSSRRSRRWLSSWSWLMCRARTWIWLA